MKIEVGEVLTNQQLMEKFGVANSGGMRRSLNNNVLLLIHNTLDSVYLDRWKDDVLLYTGMGLQGDQSIDKAQNKTLANSQTNSVSILLFEVYNPKEYTYIGNVHLSADPYYETQSDEAGKLRKVVIFPLKKTNIRLNFI